MRSIAAASAFALLLLTIASNGSAALTEPTEPAPAVAPTTVDRRVPRKRSAVEPDAVRVGFLGALGFPRPFSLEAMLQIDKAVALGVEYSFLPSINVGIVDFSYHAVAADLRIFPLQSPFFFGARLGHQNLSASGSLTVGPSQTYSASLNADSWFLNPRLGFLWVFKNGLSIGMDAGLQIPLSHTTTTTLPAGFEPPAAVSSIADTFSARVIPTVTPLQIGLLF